MCKIRLRRRKGTGTVIARGGIWVLRYLRNGKMVQESSHLKATKANRQQAEALLDNRTAINSILSEHDQLAVLIKQKESLEAKIARLQGLAAPKLTLGELADAYAASPRRKDHTPRQLQRHLDEINAFVTWAGDMSRPAAETDDKTAEKYAQSISGTISGAVYNKKLNYLSAIWTALPKSHRLANNPWADLPRKRKETHTRRTITDAEISKILSLAKGELRDLIIIGIRTGLRIGDACQLRWDAFKSDGTVGLKTAKTGAVVCLPSASLLADLGRHERTGYVVPSMAEQYKHNPTVVSTMVTRLFAEAGLTTQAKEAGWTRARADVSFHSLRHTFVTKALEAGIPLAIVQELVGHSNTEMTEHYSHIGSDAVVAAFEKAGL